LVALLLAVAAGVVSCPTFAQSTDAERLVKAAYLFHFCTLVNWPTTAFPAPDAPLRVGVLGDDELADELQKVIASRPRGGRQIEVLKLRRGREPQGLQLLFVPESQRSAMASILAPYRGHPVLIVTESENALERGSMINFVPIQGSLRFEVSQQALSESRLEISSRLLSVAWNFAPTSPKFR
jgi:hypothetical protein